MDPHEKELSPHRSTYPTGGGGNLNPNLSDVVAGDLLSTDTNEKPVDKANSQSPSLLNPNSAEVPNSSTGEASSVDVSEKPCSKQTDQSMKVFLRIRPILVSPTKSKTLRPSNDKIAWPKSKGGRVEKVKLEKKKTTCIQVSDSHSVTILPPSSLHRMKSESYTGFSHVFSADSSQEEVYAETVSPIVEDFLRGKSGLLAALGPSGSGKTHTVFGSARDPGLVPRALRHIFQSSVATQNSPKRLFYLSMFEIYIDNGKAEKLSDLSPDGGEVQLQQSSMKGLKELLITDHTQAEALIARAMLRRAVAMTNSNSQSSRSQCIINIRCTIDGKVGTQANESILTIVDLAGAEREKKTGNQGDKLLQSNFINKTSMVFGLCLRSLLEHQKNPKKPLRKHFQSSLLTRYLRDYLEGKKRMSLILTVRPTEEDYLDTSFLLRQASPFMEIKFLNKDEMGQSKRQYDTMFNVVPDRSKRTKISCSTDSMDEVKIAHTSDTCEELDEGYPKKVKVSAKPKKVPVSKVNAEMACNTVYGDSGKERDYKILLSFSKTIWSLLKEHNQKIKVLEKRNLDLEKELSDMRSYTCACQKEASMEVASLVADTNTETTSLPKELVGQRCAASDSEGEIDISKEMEKHADVCKIESDCPEVHIPSSLECKRDLEMESKFYSSEPVMLPDDHLSAFHDAKQNEIVELEDCQPETQHPQDDSKSAIDMSKKFEKRAEFCKTESDCPEEQGSTYHICKVDMEMESKSYSSEAVLSPEDQLSAFHEIKQNEMAGEVKNCRLTKMRELEKAHIQICKAEPEQLQDESQESQKFQENVHNEGSCDLKKEDNKVTCSNEGSCDLKKEDNKVTYSNKGSCDCEKEDNKETCSDEDLKASYGKMPKSSSDQSSTMASKNIRQSTRKKNVKEKKHINCDRGGNFSSASETRKNFISHEQPSVKAKPKRRLMPGSSSLLRHVNSLDFKDEEAPVGGRKGRSSGDENTSAGGSTSLLRLLRVNIHR